MLHYFSHSVRYGLLDNAKLIGLLTGHSHLPTKLNLYIPPSCWKIFIAIITQQLFRWQVPVARAHSHHFSVGVVIIIDNEPIIESNNFFSYGIILKLVYKIKIANTAPMLPKIENSNLHILKKAFG